MDQNNVGDKPKKKVDKVALGVVAFMFFLNASAIYYRFKNPEYDLPVKESQQIMEKVTPSVDKNRDNSLQPKELEVLLNELGWQETLLDNIPYRLTITSSGKMEVRLVERNFGSIPLKYYEIRIPKSLLEEYGEKHHTPM